MSWINSNATYKQNSKNDLSFYHGFSKTPVEPTSSGTAATTLANASTKGGHTVIGTEVWAEEIPWFGLVASRTAAVERLSGLTKLNDLVKIDGEGGKVYKYIGDNDATFTEAQWSSFWQEVTLTNGMTLNNRHDQAVLRYYLNQPMQTLTTTNNASIDSKGYATRLFVNESDHTGQTSGGSVISQFAAGTDNIKNGIPSVELNPKLYLGTAEKIAGTHYYDYNVSGTILWNANVASSSPKISCFRYIGKTVTDAVGTLNGDDTTDGSVAKIVKDAIDALGDIAVKSDITITDIKVQNGNEQAVSLTPNKDKSVTITIPEVQNATTTKAGIVIISDNNAIETSESASTTTATVGAVAATRSAIENQVSSHTSNNNIHITASERSSWNTAATKAGTAVQTVKRADDSSTLISVNQSGTTVSIGLSNTVATKTDISSLEDKITDKTVRINAGTNNITAKLTENENAADSYTISVDGYTTEEVDSLLKTKADEKLLENTIGKVSEITKNIQDVESNLLKHTSNADEGVLHVTQAEKDIWNAGGNALQEIKEGTHIDVNGNTIGVDTSSLVADTTFTTKVNELATAKANTAVANHENSTTKLHVTQAEKNTWNSKLSSVSASSNNDYVGATVNNGNSIVISPDVVTDISAVETGKLIDANTIKSYVDEHTSNDDIHVTIDDKNNWNRNVKNISYLFDKGDGSSIALHGGKTISKYNDGTITYTNNEITNFSVDDATIGIYTFRTASGNANWSSSTPDSLIEFNKRDIISKGASPGYGDKPEFYYEYDAFDQTKYDIDYTQPIDGLSNLIVGKGMFTRSGLTIFNDNLSNLQDGFGMFTNSRNLTTFRSALPSLTVGSKMFLGCKKMEIFKTKLPNLSWAECMFKSCDLLTTVDTCLPHLTYAQGFFAECPNLINITLSPNSCLCLYNADAMFYNCTNLTNLKINLSYLETGNQMFNGCKLNKESLEYIANNIREWPADDPHPLGIVGYSCTEDEWAVIKKIFEDKGWSVDELNSNAINLTSENNILYAKVIYGPVYDKYIDSDNNKCDILIATKVKNVDEWKIVSSIQEAAQYYNLQLNTNDK